MDLVCSPLAATRLPGLATSVTKMSDDGIVSGAGSDTTGVAGVGLSRGQTPRRQFATEHGLDDRVSDEPAKNMH